MGVAQNDMGVAQNDMGASENDRRSFKIVSSQASLGISGYLLNNFLRVKVTHQRKSEPFLS